MSFDFCSSRAAVGFTFRKARTEVFHMNRGDWVTNLWLLHSLLIRHIIKCNTPHSTLTPHILQSLFPPFQTTLNPLLHLKIRKWSQIKYFHNSPYHPTLFSPHIHFPYLPTYHINQKVSYFCDLLFYPFPPSHKEEKMGLGMKIVTILRWEWSFRVIKVFEIVKYLCFMSNGVALRNM